MVFVSMIIYIMLTEIATDYTGAKIYAHKAENELVPHNLELVNKLANCCL